jgi:ribosome-binding protein aMBF1 (putative translation factor)
MVDGDWPDGTLHEKAPPVVIVSQIIAARLEAAAGDRSTEELARDVGVDVDEIAVIRDGSAIGDFVVIAELETHLEVALWPDRRSRP